MSVTVPGADTTLDFVGLYTDQTEDVILARWIDWANEGLDPVADADAWRDTREGGHWRTVTMPGLRECARLYDLIGTEVPMSMFVLWSWGTYLDDLAAVWDVERLEATSAVGIETFSGPAGSEIPLETTLTVVATAPADPTPEFATQLEGVIPDSGDGTGSIDLPIMATEPGQDGEVAAGAILVASTPLPDGVTVTNAAATGGGSDPETDDALRERVLQATAGKGPGNVQDLLRWAMAWPGVGSAKVVPTWAGPNSALITIGDENGQPLPAEVVDSLQADLDPVPGEGEGTVPIGMQVTVDTSTPLAVTVTADVSYEEGYSATGFGNTVAVHDPIADLITAYLRTIKPGDQVILAYVSGLIATYRPGVLDVATVELNGVAANLDVTLTPPEGPYLDTLDI